MPGTSLIASSVAFASAAMVPNRRARSCGHGLAHVADAEPEEQGRERLLLRGGDGGHELLGRLLGESVELDELLGA